MNNYPYISVIIPLYNKEDSILQTVNSVLIQTYKNFELIIVDDGSTDNSYNVIEPLNKNPQLKIFQNKNSGVSYTRNYGASMAKGKFLFFLDADDLITNNCLKTLYDLSVEFPTANVISANYINVNGEGEYKAFCLSNKRCIINNPVKDFYHDNFKPRTGATLYEKKIFHEVGGFDTRISIYEDLEFDLKLMKKCTYAYTPEIIYIHNLGYSQLSINPKPINKYFANYIIIDNQSFWKKMILLGCIMATYYKFISYNDMNNANFLIKKAKSKICLFIYYRFYQKLMQIRKNQKLKRQNSFYFKQNTLLPNN